MYTCSYYDKFWNFKYYKPTYAPAPYIVLTFDRIISLSFFLQFSLRKALIHSADGIWEFCINKTKLMNNQPNSLNEINWILTHFRYDILIDLAMDQDPMLDSQTILEMISIPKSHIDWKLEATWFYPNKVFNFNYRIVWKRKTLWPYTQFAL